MKQDDDKFLIALPKGRILKEIRPVFEQCGIKIEDDCFDENSRRLRFSTNMNRLDCIRVRAFDIATIVAYGGAHIGIAGSDVINEFDYDVLLSPLDFGIGKCRLSVAVKEGDAEQDHPQNWSYINVATKYPNLTKYYFRERGVEANCIKLNGAMEIVPEIGMARKIVDLVSTGATLKANNLVEVEKIMDVSTRLIINKACAKTIPEDLLAIVESFERVLNA